MSIILLYFLLDNLAGTQGLIDQTHTYIKFVIFGCNFWVIRVIDTDGHVDKKGSEEVMGRYRELVRELKRVRVGQIVLSGILPVRGGYTRNNRRISINLRLQALCQAEGVGFLNMWEHFEQGDGLFSKDGLHLNKRGAAVLGKGFLRALGDGIGQLSLN